MENNSDITYSMYLSTIPNIKQKFGFIRSNLDVSDIKGTKSRYVENPLPIRGDPLYSRDIQKSQPKQLIPSNVNKSSFLLQIDDIEGTRTKINKFSTTRNTNPLQPQYQAPKVQFVPVQEPKFIRDNMAINDIEGVRKKETFANRVQRSGKTMDTKAEIVAKVKPTPKGFTRVRTCNDFWNVKDINSRQNYYAGNQKRKTNPLEPRYDIIGQKCYGEIDGSKCKKYEQPLRQNNSLMTSDIEGARTKVNNFVIEKKEQVGGNDGQLFKRGNSSNQKRSAGQARQGHHVGKEGALAQRNMGRPKTAVQRLDAFLK